ncbi:hypothetical protein LS70_001125 [Helicobacter sp. MIT 11-5569]|uniref:hypothetical protein n=1 Tax=Helicobacter sp. MIT 11-5569 TaxID=1548151 RepID=UPI00051F8D70|nr:hypothetical protein [Helicobacter sp. MIT 11-5569]TLD85182.1 hypothetical protein LS70_001125 [Helicobacter sp. MIT 11-5569]
MKQIKSKLIYKVYLVYDVDLEQASGLGESKDELLSVLVAKTYDRKMVERIERESEYSLKVFINKRLKKLLFLLF